MTVGESIFRTYPSLGVSLPENRIRFVVSYLKYGFGEPHGRGIAKNIFVLVPGELRHNMPELRGKGKGNES